MYNNIGKNAPRSLQNVLKAVVEQKQSWKAVVEQNQSWNKSSRRTKPVVGQKLT